MNKYYQVTAQTIQSFDASNFYSFSNSYNGSETFIKKIFLCTFTPFLCWVILINIITATLWKDGCSYPILSIILWTFGEIYFYLTARKLFILPEDQGKMNKNKQNKQFHSIMGYSSFFSAVKIVSSHTDSIVAQSTFSENYVLISYWILLMGNSI